MQNAKQGTKTKFASCKTINFTSFIFSMKFWSQVPFHVDKVGKMMTTTVMMNMTTRQIPSKKVFIRHKNNNFHYKNATFDDFELFFYQQILFWRKNISIVTQNKIRLSNTNSKSPKIAFVYRIVCNLCFILLVKDDGSYDDDFTDNDSKQAYLQPKRKLK